MFHSARSPVRDITVYLWILFPMGRHLVFEGQLVKFHPFRLARNVHFVPLQCAYGHHMRTNLTQNRCLPVVSCLPRQSWTDKQRYPSIEKWPKIHCPIPDETYYRESFWIWISYTPSRHLVRHRWHSWTWLLESLVMDRRFLECIWNQVSCQQTCNRH